MDPFSAMAVVSTGLQVAGAIGEGNAGYAQGRHEEAVALENARRAQQNASQIRLAGQSAEQAKRRELRRSLGRSAAAMAQAGTGGGGSNALLMKQASTEAEFDAQNLRSGYEADAYAQDPEALNQKTAAQAARRRARGARTAGYINAASAAIGGFSNYSGMKAQRAALKPSVRSTRGPRYGVDIGIQNRGA
jgi:hypothetical protein